MLSSSEREWEGERKGLRLQIQRSFSLWLLWCKLAAAFASGKQHRRWHQYKLAAQTYMHAGYSKPSSIIWIWSGSRVKMSLRYADLIPVLKPLTQKWTKPGSNRSCLPGSLSNCLWIRQHARAKLHVVLSSAKAISYKARGLLHSWNPAVWQTRYYEEEVIWLIASF